MPGLGGAAQAAGATLSHPVMLVLFLLSATQPYSILAGPLLIGPYRLLLMILSIPLILGWVRGKYGGFLASDFLMLGHVIWISVALAANGQASRIIEYGVAQVFDIFVAYLLGRAAIRSKQDFYLFAKFFLLILLILVPFAFLESTQGKMIIQNLFRGIPNLKVFNDTTLNYPQRLGLMRAQTSINHPIVYGVYSSIGFSFGFVAMKYYKGGQGFFKRLIWGAGSIGGVFFSLSAGALVSLMVQFMLIGWNKVMAALEWRWYLFAGVFSSVYIFLDIVAARPPLLVMARFVAFSGSTAWNRYLIWRFGTDEVWRHPIFGMGLFEDWIRARWMVPSIDNHWLLVAMRFGLPAIILLLGAYFYVMTRLARTNLKDDPELSAIRYAYFFTFSGMFVSLVTVNCWHVTYSLLLMLVGGATWIFNEPRGDAPEAPPPSEKELRRAGKTAPEATKPAGEQTATAGNGSKALPYTRFPGGR